MAEITVEAMSLAEKYPSEMIKQKSRPRSMHSSCFVDKSARKQSKHDKEQHRLGGTCRTTENSSH